MKFLFFKKEFDFLIIEGNVASVEKDFGPEEFTIENLIKAFAFGMEDLSLPGKERKGKLLHYKNNPSKEVMKLNLQKKKTIVQKLKLRMQKIKKIILN